ncbi:MAG TPA: hypothetical protein VHP64_00445 [Candidatus Limnocylindria bacterium]|jgi:hypothetical protein|nr:hypothetical protein [Candidatus Limnocylindria bacterium]
MINRLRGLGIVLGLIGLAFVVAGGFAFFKVQEGTASLNAFSEAQGVELAYNEDGQLVDRGETAGADKIMALLTDDWGYPVVSGELDPADPLVNTASEYMFQMATVAYHTLYGEQTIVLEEDVEYNGEVFAAGTYQFPIEGRYWADFDREHPLEGPARGQAWTGVAHALIAELGVGTVTAQALTLGLALAGLFAGLGGTLIIAGAGLVWATRAEKEKVPALRPASIPA